MAGMYADPVTMSPKYNYTYSYTFYIQQTVLVYTLVFSLLTVVLYVGLVVHLVRQRKGITHSSASYKEKWIFAQAIIRFLADVTLNSTFHLGPTLTVLPQWMMISIMIGYIIDHLVVPPLLYVTLNRQLRKEIFLLNKTPPAVFNSGMIRKPNLSLE
ncbi:hypothetical protein L596_026680 [Steinernema carpocapsae]|uniref:Uncharacterized protein n=1 Tax=Steinernema carpocapsae TaxID=34508 RepID=A0A4U5M279_STECR|nr:hypothetical protein L596_026680 [Steinernema carpocapsae]